MPAGLPGSTVEDNTDNNPSAGRVVVFDPLSGPKGAPLDSKVFDYSTGTPAGWNASTRVPILVDNDDESGVSTGALQTGIGFGTQVISQQGDRAGHGTPSAPLGIFSSGYNDNGIPGEEPTYTAPPPPGVVTSNAIDSTRMYIGGGNMIANEGTLVADRGVPFIPLPYDEGIAICAAGNGAPRDDSVLPTGFPLKAVTASGAVAAGAAIEAGWENRSGVAMVTGQSAHGIGTTALAEPDVPE